MAIHSTSCRNVFSDDVGFQPIFFKDSVVDKNRVLNSTRWALEAWRCPKSISTAVISESNGKALSRATGTLTRHAAPVRWGRLVSAESKSSFGIIWVTGQLATTRIDRRFSSSTLYSLILRWFLDLEMGKVP